MVLKLKAAYFGEHGSYTEQAAMQHFGSAARLKPCKFISEVLDSVGRDCEFGVVPIENSIEGAVSQTYDLLLNSKLNIVGEEIVRIAHCLIANDGVKISDIKIVYSHPQGIAQCRAYIERNGFEALPFHDTAGSVKMLKDNNLRNAAAIASARAAGIYGMKILDRNIQANKHNYTRFVVVSDKKGNVKASTKTTIAFSAKNRPGTLFKALDSFARNKVNLLYIQSRPIPGEPWEYNFYIDCEGGIGEPKVRKALRELDGASDFVKVLGSYKKARFDKHDQDR